MCMSIAEAAYLDIKNALISWQVLIPYDPKFPLVLATDASKKGFNATPSYCLSNGKEKPIGYASCNGCHEDRYRTVISLN